MEKNEISVEDILCIIGSLPRGDCTGKQRAKRSSVKLYCSLLYGYDVRLACDRCIHIDDGTHKCGLSTCCGHKCDRNRLVLFAKNTTDDGELLRKRPAGYNPLITDRICEHLELNEPCLERHLSLSSLRC